MRGYYLLQLREIFHLEFLRWLGKKIKGKNYALKGGVNLRFFFNSFRYSEDMDLDVSGVTVDILTEAVMKILRSPSFQDSMKPFGIEEVAAPNILNAKQTETTQRFKIHLITLNGEDLFTKVEFSRRGFKGNIVVQSVSDTILRGYKIAPLLVPHYAAQSAIIQKVASLAARSAVQARDIFDLYILTSQYSDIGRQKNGISGNKGVINISKLAKAYDNIFEVGYEQFRDTVLSYFAPEDRGIYESAAAWEEVKLKAANFIDELRERNA